MKKLWHRITFRRSWYVRYFDGANSVNMLHGTAKDYAKMFGGIVIFDPKGYYGRWSHIKGS